ncbi:MAG TPA: hypothetical protein VM821_04810 [Abditibacteriaceae bacterium]|jgi:hypothetical protein|nr:hypothetical protein [Abditibacteriaceae bacterium]
MNEPPVPPFHDSPPIPPPAGDLCPVCHAPLQGRPKFCPNCGVILAQVSGGTSCWISLVSISLILLALAFGSVGACFLLFAQLAGMGSNDSQTYGIIAFCLLAALGCSWAVVALNRRRK